MPKIMHTNECRVRNILLATLPKLIDLTNKNLLPEDCCKFSDGIYLLYDVPITYDMAYVNFVNEFEPKANLNKIVHYARKRFGGNHYENDIRKLILNNKTTFSQKRIDFVIVDVSNKQIVNMITFEVASEDHFSGKYCLNKTISDCLKANGSKTKTHILDARYSAIHNLPDTIREAVKILVTER